MSSELSELLAALIVWIEWMTMSEQVWFPAPSDIWQSVADVINESLRADVTGVKFYECDDNKPNCTSTLSSKNYLVFQMQLIFFFVV